MVVRTSYSGMQESVHNKTVDPATSFSFHCPSYQYPIFTGMHEFPYFLLSYNYNRKSKFFSFFILPFFFSMLHLLNCYFHCPSYQYIYIFTITIESQNSSHSLFFHFFFNVIFIKLLLPLSFVSVSYIYRYIRISSRFPLSYNYNRKSKFFSFFILLFFFNVTFIKKNTCDNYDIIR